MKDLIASPIALGALLLGYVSLVLGFLILRRKARRTFSRQPVRQIPWWKRVCWYLCAGLVAGAIAWIGANADLFAGLVSSLDEICPSLVPQAECDRATDLWQDMCIALMECAGVIIVIIAWIARGAANWTQPNSDHFYPIFLLASSHCLLVASWLLCIPLMYPLQVFGIIGKRHWIDVSSMFAFFAVLGYMIGTALWILALISILYAWRSRPRNRTPAGEQWPGGLERELIRLEQYP